MKIIIPRGVTIPTGAESLSQIKLANSQLDFSEIGPGKFQGLVPIQFNGVGENTLSKLVKVEVQSEASDNNRGARRVMLKVNLPYSRAVRQADGSYAFDSVSGGSATAHVVLSIPTRMKQDLIEQNDAAVSGVASAHLSILRRLLMSLTKMFGTDVLTFYGETVADTGRADFAPAEIGYRIVVGQDGQFQQPESALKTVHPVSIDAGGGALQFAKVDTSPTFGSDGFAFAIPKTAGEDLVSTSRDPLVRGLFGLRPIEENSTVVAPVTVAKDIAG